MRICIDTKSQSLEITQEDRQATLGLYTREAFELISQAWLKVGWNQKYVYTFTWMGRPIIQLPEDMIRIQEVLYRVKPDVVIETGIAHGGSLIYYASLCKAMGKGRVIGIDIEIRKQNRIAVETHELFPYITLIEGNSTEETTVRAVKSHIDSKETVLVILDSNHSKEHVLVELEAYHGLVTRGSYIVATDGIMKELSDVPRGNSDWTWNNPAAAALEFSKNHPEFVMEQPPWPFNESGLDANVTHWPCAFLKRK